MNDDRRETPSKLDRGMARLVAGMSAGWRALAAAYARITPSTPPLTHDVRPNEEKIRHANEDGL